MSEWISVKDELPESGQDVLLVHMIRDDASAVMSGWRDGSHWFENCYYGKPALVPEEDVTHWMPMPKTPDEKGQ